LPTPLTVPHQDYLGSSNYYTDDSALEVLQKTIEYNLEHGEGRPFIPFLSLTYDGTARYDKGVDPVLNRAKSSMASKYNCTVIWMYALNPPWKWMTPPLFRKEFEAIQAHVDGSRDRYLTAKAWPDDYAGIGSDWGDVILDPPGGVYPVNTSVAIHAIANEGSEFVRWHVKPSGESFPNTPDIIVIMDVNKEIWAQFKNDAVCGQQAAAGGFVTAVGLGSALLYRKRRKRKSNRATIGLVRP
jgi:hypothetical protein